MCCLTLVLISTHAADGGQVDSACSISPVPNLPPTRSSAGPQSRPMPRRAATVGVAEYLLGCGADIDARDIDHESTPAQYMVAKRPEIARYLVGRGCKTDILMAAAFGDSDLIRHHLDADPDAIRMRVSEEYFPMIGPRSGGTIYQWELGWHVSAVQVAKSFDHSESFDVTGLDIPRPRRQGVSD
jgi:hypothetical protein